MTDGKGKPVPFDSSITAFGLPQPQKVDLAPGKEIELYELRLVVRPASCWQQRGSLRVYGTGKVWFQYERSWQLPTGRSVDPSLSKLATGKLELEIKSEVKTPQKPEQEPAANGEIVGQLLDATTGKPVEGATIACGAIVNDSGQGGGANAVTDAQGRYRLPVPSPGIYNVWLKKFDKDPSKTAAADDGLLVEAGKVATSQLQLVVGRKVTGKVVDSDGKPLANLPVSCNSPAQPQSGGVDSVQAKADGTFEFSLPPGRAYVYVVEPVEQTKDNPFGVGRSAHAHIEVSAMKDVAPLTLTLQKTEAKFGDPEWLKRSTPGTQIVRREGKQTVNGTVVDEKGKPVTGAKVFREDGPIVPTNDKGEFRMETMKGTQFVMHAFAPGYHVWFGTPTSGDVLKIVLEPKQKPK